MTQDQREGAARESIVAADLLRRGFDVFSAVSGNAPFDLVAHKLGILLRVEVKGNKGGIPRSGPHGMHSQKHGDCRRFDVMAVVEGANTRYMRSLLHTFNTASTELVGEEKQSDRTTFKNRERAKRMLEEAQC